MASSVAPDPDIGRPRLSREDRRSQLLDAAGDLLVERGTAAVTMERLAEWSGVSKALPYAHFDNSDAVLVALYERETTRLAGRVAEALAGRSAEADPAPVAVRAFFDAVVDQGELLGIVSAPGSAVAELADDGERVGPAFVTDLLIEHFDADAVRAKAAAAVVIGILTSAVDAWAAAEGGRKRMEAVAVDAIHGAVGRPR